MARDFYVSTTGDDSDSGLTLTEPYRSLAKALTHPDLAAGSTVYLRAGTYSPDAEWPDDPTTSIDRWVIEDKNGTASASITIKAYNNEAVYLDGLDIYPDAPLINGQDVVYPPLLNFFKCSYISFEDITVRNSLGVGVRIEGGLKPLTDSNYTSATAHHITIDNCVIHGCHNQALQVWHANAITITNSEIYYCQYIKSGGGVVQGKNAFNLTFGPYNIIHNTYGEPFVADANDYISRYINVIDNVFANNEQAVYLHDIRDAEVTGNFWYWTDSYNLNKYAWGALILRNLEANKYSPSLPNTLDRILVANNIMVNGASTNALAKARRMINVTATADDPTYDYVSGPVENVYLVNNVMVNAETANFQIYNAGGTIASCVFKNNISVNSAAKHVLKAGSSSGWDADYNLYSTTPTTITGITDGANDVVDSPGLSNTSKLPVWTAGSYTKPSDYDDANGFRLDAGSAAINAGADVESAVLTNTGYTLNDDFDFAQDASNRSRSGTWDIGAHEYDIAGATVSAAVEGGASYSGFTGTAINFTCTATGGTSPYTYKWYFGDGNTSAAKDPAHTYSSIGTYTAYVIVTDTKGYVTRSSDLTVTVRQDVADAPVKVEIVEVDAGDATYAVTAQPKAILILGGLATAYGTLANDARMSIGAWTSGGSVNATTFSEDNLSTSDVRSVNTNAGVLNFLTNADGATANLATIDSVSATAVAMTWPANENTEKILTVNISGTGITNATATTMTMGAIGTTTTLTGDYNTLIVPCVPTGGINANTTEGTLSFAVLTKANGYGCHVLRSSNGNNPSQVIEYATTGAAAVHPPGSRYLAVDSWTTSGITLRCVDGDFNSTIPVLAFNSSAVMYAGTFDLPTATGATSFNTIAATTPQFAMLWGGVATTLDSRIISNVGSFNIGMVDSGGDFIMGIADEDNITPMDTYSYATNAFNPLDKDGDTLAEGALALVSGGFSLTLTKADSTARKWFYWIVDASDPASQIDAQFDYERDGWTAGTDKTVIYAGQQVNFFDLSGSAFTVDTWDWDWGDGTAHGTTQNPNHTYSKAGTYTVVLTAEDTNSDSDTATKEITVLVPEPTISYTTTPADGVGDATLSCEIDGSGITAGTGEVIDYVRWRLYAEDIYSNSDTSIIDQLVPLYDSGNVAVDASIAFSITTAGKFDLALTVAYENYPYTFDYIYNDVFVVSGSSITVKIETSIASGQSVVGETDIDFQAVYNNRVLDGSQFASILWEPSGGLASSTDWQPTITFPANGTSSAISYDIDLTVTAHDGSTYTDSITNIITIDPTPTAAPSLDTSLAAVTALTANAAHFAYFFGLVTSGYTWVQQGAPNTSVWLATVDAPHAVAFNGVRVTEDGEKLTEVASIAACQAAAGSAYTTQSGDDLLVYVHATGSGSPNTNGLHYMWITSSLFRHAGDGIDVGETVTMWTDRYYASVSEGVEVGETLSVWTDRYYISVTEGVGVGESITVWLFRPSVSDAIGVGDWVGLSIV